MSRVPFNDPDDDFAVEMTSLDAPETPLQAPNSLLQGSRLAPRVRTWLTILSVVGGLLLIFVVLSPVLSSLLPKKTSTPPALHVSPAQIGDVTIQNGIAYITSSDGIFRAVDLKNGSLLWQRNLGGGAPFFINNTIYSNQGSTVQALSAINGTILWKFKTSQDISPLIIDNGAAYTLFPFSSPGHILTALDSRSGAELWHYTMNMPPSTSLYVQEMQDKIYINIYADNQNQVKNMDSFVLRVSDGSLLWHVKATAMQPIQSKLVDITTSDGILHVLRSDNGHEVWHYKYAIGANFLPTIGDNLFYIQTQKGSLQALSIDNGALLWTYNDPWGIAEVFTDTNGVLYVETGDGFIVALRTSDGRRLWHVRPVTPPLNSGLIQVEDGIVYSFITVAGAQDETVVALRPRDGSILWRRQLDTSNSNMSPLLFNGLLFADSGSTITALRAHDGAVLWHADYILTTTPQYSSGFLALADNIVILRLSDSVMEAHQLETGAVLWRYPR